MYQLSRHINNRVLLYTLVLSTSYSHSQVNACSQSLTNYTTNSVTEDKGGKNGNVDSEAAFTCVDIVKKLSPTKT